MNGCNRIPSADDRSSIFIPGDRLCDFLRAGGARRCFKDSHRAIPDNGARVGDLVGVKLDRFGTDVQSHVAVWDRLIAVDRLRWNVVLDLHGDDVVDRERSEEHTSELQSLTNLVCRLLLENKKTY